MTYTVREASPSEAVKIARMLKQSLANGVDGRFNIDPQRLLTHVQETIASLDGFAIVLLHNDEPVGCFMGHLVPHAYCAGNIVQELGVYINSEHRGGGNFRRLFEEFVHWSGMKPDVLLTTFTIGQLGATTPYLRSVMAEFGFTKGDEGYFKT